MDRVPNEIMGLRPGSVELELPAWQEFHHPVLGHGFRAGLDGLLRSPTLVPDFGLLQSEAMQVTLAGATVWTG